ncbi:protease PrsW [Paenibacillus sp. J31TS4]|uniref:glutamic-type intramembrane protease PrsW n=1 Tax=Paenibacillus sp. J31TS4 TaxID=2807195 RepID=UPI001B07C621|nr:glutamic-type intramembrane protease PrsW [Paenibacillus sp. J31TS4]GIP37498.1 protease PrsW [Paenibacillus sp. J31TS4]
MTWLSLLAAAVAPGLALLSYFYLKDRYETEPIHMVLRLFLFGVLLVFPIMMVQRALVLAFGENPYVFSFVYSGGIEELFKWLILYLVIYKHLAFDEPYDGIVYAVAVSLGFATMENVFYVFLNYSSFLDLMVRALMPVSGHALFGVAMGYYMGSAKFHPARKNIFLLASIATPILYHGVFDLILIKAETYWLYWMLPLMLFLWGRSLWKVQHANDRSPLRGLMLDERA